MKGKQITNINQVLKLAQEGKCVVLLLFRPTRLPAAFVQNWQARLLQTFIERKLVFAYKKIAPLTRCKKIKTEIKWRQI